MKIQALAVAAATLALAAPALPAHASELRTAINVAARQHCGALNRGATWTQAIRAGMNSPYGRRWYPAGTESQRRWLSGQYQGAVSAICQAAERRAYTAHNGGGGLDQSPTYTGGSTTIQEDPFEF